MADYDNDGEYEEDVVEEEEVPEYADEVVVEQTESQRSEIADLTKLLRQHPEIWIPYEEQVMEKITISAPGTGTAERSTLQTYLRDNSVLDSNHKTYPFLSNYERTKCISFRASQLCNGAKPYIQVPEGISDAYTIAKMELDAKRLPFIIKRPMPDGSFEAWRLADLLML